MFDFNKVSVEKSNQILTFKQKEPDPIPKKGIIRQGPKTGEKPLKNQYCLQM